MNFTELAKALCMAAVCRGKVPRNELQTRRAHMKYSIARMSVLSVWAHELLNDDLRLYRGLIEYLSLTSQSDLEAMFIELSKENLDGGIKFGTWWRHIIMPVHDRLHSRTPGWQASMLLKPTIKIETVRDYNTFSDIVRLLVPHRRGATKNHKAYQIRIPEKTPWQAGQYSEQAAVEYALRAALHAARAHYRAHATAHEQE